MAQNERLTPVSLLILSGGVGQRSRHHEPKQFYEIGGHPMIALSVIAALQVKGIAEVLINAPEGYEERTSQIMTAYAGTVPHKVVPAGKTRQESSRLLAEAASHDVLILHEAARPLVTPSMFQELLDFDKANVGFTQQIPFSMCQVNMDTNIIEGGVARDKVFNVQLPQRFDRSTLLAAHKAALEQGKSYTEDAVMCIEMTSADIYSLPGTSSNLKITNWEDFIIAEHILHRLN